MSKKSESQVDELPVHFIFGTDPTEEEKVKIVQFIKAISESEEYKKHEAEASLYVTEYNAHRFLTARDYNQKKALNLLKLHLTWRFDTYRPSEIKPSDVEQYALKGAVQSTPRGTDKYGRPLLILDDSKENVKIKNAAEKQKQSMKHLVFHMERNFSMFNNTVRRYVLFINLQDFKLFSAPPMKTTKETINIFGSQYPEMLGNAILYKAPWAFTQFWKAIQYFIDPITREKIVFISGDCSDGSKNDKKLKGIIGDEWKTITGVGLPQKDKTYAYGYNHEEAWAKVVETHPQASSIQIDTEAIEVTKVNE